MITVGLSHHEIERITKILDEHQAHYQVDAAGGDAENVKVKAGRGDTSFYQIEIPAEEFAKLSAASVGKLADLGIFPEMEEPDFNAEPPKEHKAADATRMRNNMKKFEKIFIVLLIVMGLAFVSRVMKGH